MALIVENGTGKADAESYITVADADTRQANLGMTNWATLTTSEKEQALRRATQYMLQAYRGRWTGRRNTLSQALDWPRYGVEFEGWPVSVTIVPAEVAGACSDLALKAAAGELNSDLSRAVVRKKIGPLETEYDPHSPQAPRYRAIDMALNPYLKGSSASVGLVRS